jgi:hypothetical protein
MPINTTRNILTKDLINFLMGLILKHLTVVLQFYIAVLDKLRSGNYIAIHR